eukprot:gene13889-19815_t
MILVKRDIWWDLMQEKKGSTSLTSLPLGAVERASKRFRLQAARDLSSPWPEWQAPRIPRGDLQSVFVFKGFDEVRRLGLRQETERDVRQTPAQGHGNVDKGGGPVQSA